MGTTVSFSDRKVPEVRIGVYVCHCGTNIANVVGVKELAQFASGLPGVVVSREYRYMCSEPGQEMIAKDIREHRLDRVVVASCSPLLHEQTFRTATSRGGINPFFFQMVNIRENVSWVHEDGKAATRKAKDLVRAAVARIAHHKALQPRSVKINPDVLVIGAGIAGIHASLTLASANKKVFLVEKEPTIGGHMAKFDKTFPTLDCAACILTPKMSQVKANKNINLWTCSEVVSVEGYVGNFKVKIRRSPRYVIEDRCIGCLQCIEGCVFKKPTVKDEFNLGLSRRKPIYMPFPQAIPQVALIDPETCIELKTGKCKKGCVTACGERNAIDFTQKEEVKEIQVGSIVLASGFKTFDPTKLAAYGYGKFPNVFTSLELERMVTASGPTGGDVVLKDGTKPRAVGIVHCVGSRDENTNRWCSKVCCMYSLKLAHLVKERTGAQVYNFYIDMRTPGKGYDEFYGKLLEEGVHFVRGRVAEVSDWPAVPTEEGRLVMRVEDTLSAVVRRIPVDMVVLSVGLEPGADANELRRMLNISCSTGGFFLERHPKLAPVNTATDGIFLAGACQGPKDIPDTVAQAGAAAAEAMALVDRGAIDMEPNTAHVDEKSCSGCKSCIGLCPYKAISFDGAKRKAVVNEALCKGCGTCTAACPSGSIGQNLFENEQILSEIRGVFGHV